MAANRCGGRARCRPLRGAAAVALTASITFAGAACASSATHSGTATGTALARGYVTIFGLAPIKPGTQLGLLYASVYNRSHSPMVIRSVTLVGRGVGTVINVVDTKIAPLETGANGVPGGAYEVFPPAAYWSPTRSCGKQVLVPLPGFLLAPGALARVWMRIQGAKPGPFHVDGEVVRYRQDGVIYRQVIPTGYQGSVSGTAPFIPIDKQQARCMKSENTRPLSGHYLRKPKDYN